MSTLHDPKNQKQITHQSSNIKSARVLLSVVIATYALVACSPTVKIEPPDKPIVINLNVKIEHEIKIKVDKELDQLLSDDELF
ncbi:YnbE family lipoprotein [Shewanella pneumatophori]|uniref:YnbE family lipoprotein n=1 Tax=Shewanella pneumatophori TaxID=314092 RepID=A0A9X2CBS0_9GAMM|nr:YnbE family lipoprotein [Shewanella pneumatophori]MCL1137073.1 YnbE family lipoprotein [Shewanella pneumatophori]